MIDMGIPVIMGTVVAEVLTLISSSYSVIFLNRSDGVKYYFNSRVRTGAHGWEDATNSKRLPKTIIHKNSATATQMKFERHRS